MTDETAMHYIDGEPVLSNPLCPDCERPKIAVYECVSWIGWYKRCGHRVSVDGHYRWSWQGKGHWHEPWDQAAFRAALALHAEEIHGTNHTCWAPRND